MPVEWWVAFVQMQCKCGVMSAMGPGRVKISRNLGRTAHFAAAELLIRWNRPPIISVATRSFM
jgi:hypothetical protein